MNGEAGPEAPRAVVEADATAQEGQPGGVAGGVEGGVLHPGVVTVAVQVVGCEAHTGLK